jgi:hypothetical protein
VDPEILCFLWFGLECWVYFTGITVEHVNMWDVLRCCGGCVDRVSLVQGHYELWRGLCIIMWILDKRNICRIIGASIPLVGCQSGFVVEG